LFEPENGGVHLTDFDVFEFRCFRSASDNMFLSLILIAVAALGGLALTYLFAEKETFLWRFGGGQHRRFVGLRSRLFRYRQFFRSFGGNDDDRAFARRFARAALADAR
jgi:hypothetical protein